MKKKITESDFSANLARRGRSQLTSSLRIPSYEKIMTAKTKGTSPKGTIAKPAVKVAAKMARKEPTAKKPRKDQSGNSNERTFPPEVLAHLAIRLVRLDADAATGGSRPRPQVSSPAFDPVFADALKRAEMLLVAASGNSNEDVHAYQLFVENSGSMSFGDIAARFNEVGWIGMGSGNTVKEDIEELVHAAELAVQERCDRHQRLVSIRQGYAGGVFHLVDQVKEWIRNMIQNTELREILIAPDQVSDAMGEFFFELMEKGIPGDWERLQDEEHGTLASLESFITYVCGGLTYEQFMGEPTHVRMDFDRLRCLIFFLEELGAKYPDQSRSAVTDLDSLIRLVRGRNDVPDEAINNMETCLAELTKEEPDSARVKELADNACLLLKSMWDGWYLIRLCSGLECSKLLREVRGRIKERKTSYKVSVAKTEQILKLLLRTKNAKKGTEPFMDAGRLRTMLDEARKGLDVPDLTTAIVLPVAKIRKTLKLLRRADKAGRGRGEPMNADQLRSLLDEILEGLKDPDLYAAASVPAQGFNGVIADEMKRVADEIKKGLGKMPFAGSRSQKELSSLLNELRPYSGERRCRPYELFLFAAQNQLLKKKLIRICSALSANYIPNPPYPFPTLSILESHGGALRYGR